MFDSAISTLQQGVDKIEKACNDTEFQNAINAFVTYLQKHSYECEYWKELEQHAFYQKNEFSEYENNKNLNDAKRRVLEYIQKNIIEGGQPKAEFTDNEKVKIACKMTENFHEYIKALRKRIPHQKAGIKKEVYEGIDIVNEYDLQHIMYAYLKPIFLEIRDEVPEDSGYAGIRLDFKIDENIVIETKCTRASMSEKELIEQIAADVSLYKHKNIIIYVYDKEGIVKNVHAFKKNFSDSDGHKNVFVYVAQGIEL